MTAVLMHGNTLAGKWTPEHDALLTRHAADGLLTYSNISGEINAKFGTRYSRNAVLGRAKRLGLLIANPRVNGYPPSEPKAKVRKPATPKPAKPASEPKPRRTPALSPEFSPLRCVEVVPRNIGLLELEPGDCRWPDGNGPFTFCGHPKMAAASYCRTHLALSVAVRT